MKLLKLDGKYVFLGMPENDEAILKPTTMVFGKKFIVPVFNFTSPPALQKMLSNANSFQGLRVRHPDENEDDRGGFFVSESNVCWGSVSRQKPLLFMLETSFAMSVI